jgi:hypothetical protein
LAYLVEALAFLVIGRTLEVLTATLVGPFSGIIPRVCTGVFGAASPTIVQVVSDGDGIFHPLEHLMKSTKA